ncbi:hypothetical protein PUNSTDRAFT_59363 [Punctularia strigosozonata HHB-11173 SS5]|uniref:uncharacterized protein n=1 Tax=Punctularia strigosozonata (strain HHB-11173) TaxID=741275 RepID=UPI00044165AB|nr:uncharacterized protein PUNSTDRAFT_59363 [Punctularia strigosozonata HHB-11173 SS5]EIN14085.1 hypothetical protein PUNSTDRAFT_59363 [Punctularia strigosozonata HHB-11173 SS5]
MDHSNEKFKDRRRDDPFPSQGVVDKIIWLLAFPLRSASNVFLYALGVLRGLSPQLIPIAICALFIPFLILTSMVAGILVWKSTAVGWEMAVYLNYGDGVPPYAEVPVPLMSPRQAYDISVHLTVPGTESNFALGNFMATLTLVSRSNETLTRVRKPAIILPPAPSLLWKRSQSQLIDITIPLLDAYSASSRGIVARIEVGRKDEWRSVGAGQGREVSVISLSLRGALRHKGLRGLFSRFPLLTAIASTIFFISISSMVLAVCLVPVVTGGTLRGLASVAQEGPDTGDKKPALPGTSQAQSVHRRSRSGERIRKRKSVSVGRSRSAVYGRQLELVLSCCVIRIRR